MEREEAGASKSKIPENLLEINEEAVAALWEHAPEGANWLAHDITGWYWYGKKPSLRDNEKRTLEYDWDVDLAIDKIDIEPVIPSVYERPNKGI